MSAYTHFDILCPVPTLDHHNMPNYKVITPKEFWSAMRNKPSGRYYKNDRGEYIAFYFRQGRREGFYGWQHQKLIEEFYWFGSCVHEYEIAYNRPTYDRIYSCRKCRYEFVENSS